MANLYGVANPAGYPLFANTIGGANISCPSGVNTACFTSGPFIAPSQGYFYVMVWVHASILMGATPPNSIAFATAIGAGSYTNASGPAATWTASAIAEVSAVTFSAISQTAWQGAGSTVSVACNPFGQTVQVDNVGTWATFVLYRAPDQ